MVLILREVFLEHYWQNALQYICKGHFNKIPVDLLYEWRL